MGVVCGSRKASNGAENARKKINKEKVATQEIRPKNSECLLLARSVGRASSDGSVLVQMGGNNSTLDQTEFDWRHLV